DAYPIADDQVRVVFDRNVTPATATTLTNYSLASFGSVTGAVMEGGAVVRLTIDNGLSHADLEAVTVNSIAAASNGQVMASPQTLQFVNGVHSCAEVQAANPDSLALPVPNCVDKSRFAGAAGQFGAGIPGPRLSFVGTAVGAYQALYILNDENQATR